MITSHNVSLVILSVVIAIITCFGFVGRKLAESALRKSEARNRALINAIPDLMIRMTKNGTYLDFKPAKDFKTIRLGGEMIGKNLYEVMPLEVARQRMHYVEQALQTGNTQIYEFQFTIDGNIHYEEARIVVSGEDEVLSIIRDISYRKQAEEALKKAYDELEIRVEERTTELRNTNDRLLVEITERKRVEAEISKLNEDLKSWTIQLEAANKELEAFSYSVSHDLRAPLRAINGFSRILLQEHAPGLAPEAKRYLQLVKDNAQQMGCLVDDLLTFSRLSRSALKKQLVHPENLVRQVLANLREEQQNRHVEISISEMPACQADPALLKQVWVNLLANALKFTRQREVARISVGYQQIDNERVYFVKDNGVGFDMRYGHKLFGVFQRLHRAEEYEGTGVGLAIVQRIIHRHSGRAWAEAEVNVGAAFYFTLGGDILDDRNPGRNPAS